MANDKLREGQSYTLEELNSIFDFDYDKPSGIKKSNLGYIVLFSNDTNNPYFDEQVGEIILYEGQNTGSEEQQLIYGNKDLYDAYSNGNTKILFFKNYIFKGEYYIPKQPFMKNGSWFFPLAKGVTIYTS